MVCPLTRLHRRRRQTREARRPATCWLDTLSQDIHYAARRFRRERTVTILTAATLALGIGSSAAIFSVADRVLLKPLPYPNAGEIVTFAQAPAVYGQTGAAVQPEVAALPEFTAIGLYAEGGANLNVQESPLRIPVAAATAGFFDVLGVAPLQGRTFDRSENRYSKVAVITAGLRQRILSGDSAVVGRSIRLNGRSFVVVGVMPPGFTFPGRTEVWIPPLSDPQVSDGGLSAVGRMARGVSVARAAAALSGVYRRMYGARYDVAAPLSPLHSQLVQGTRPTLLFLSALVGLLLVATCANLAGVLLARLRGRERELVVRRALGAGRGRLVRQLITEAFVVTGAGALAGGALAIAALRLFDAGGRGVGLEADVGQVDGRFLAVVALVSILSGLFFSVGPALAASGRPEGEILRGGAVRRHHASFGASLTVSQIGFALVLLVATSSALSALVRLVHVDLGLGNGRAFVMEVTLPNSRYGKQGAADAFVDQLESVLKAMPGIRKIGATDGPPGSNADLPSTPVTLDRAPIPQGRTRPPQAQLLAATPGYFQTAGIRLIAGRRFTEEDRGGRPRVVILSDTAARLLDSDPSKLIGRRLPMGQQLWGGVQSPPAYDAEIVGIVASVRLQGIQGQAPMQVYRPMKQARGGRGAIGFVVDGGPRAAGAISAAREALLKLDAELPPYNITRLADLKARFLSTERLTAALATAFSIIALALCVIGLYGLLTQQVTERTREIGIRIALGAAASRLRLRIVRASACMALVGIACGGLAAAVGFRLASHLIPGLGRPTVPAIGAAAALLLVAAIAAAWVPARRASAVDPAEALRAE
jgi:predicted permease